MYVNSPSWVTILIWNVICLLGIILMAGLLNPPMEQPDREFWRGTLESLVGSSPFYLPIFVIMMQGLIRRGHVYKLWGFHLSLGRPMIYHVIQSTHVDIDRRSRACSIEQGRILKLWDMFTDLQVRSFCRATIGEVLGSKEIKSVRSLDGNIIIVGSPKHNDRCKTHLDRLRTHHDLPYDFVKNTEGDLTISRPNGSYDSDLHQRGHDNEPDHYDHALLIYAPGEKIGSTVHVLAGIHTSGTQAAVDASLSSPCAAEIFTNLRQQRSFSPFFAAVIRIEQKDGTRGDPQIVEVTPLSPCSRMPMLKAPKTAFRLSHGPDSLIRDQTKKQGHPNAPAPGSEPPQSPS